MTSQPFARPAPPPLPKPIEVVALSEEDLLEEEDLRPTVPMPPPVEAAFPLLAPLPIEPAAATTPVSRGLEPRHRAAIASGLVAVAAFASLVHLRATRAEATEIPLAEGAATPALLWLASAAADEIARPAAPDAKSGDEQRPVDAIDAAIARAETSTDVVPRAVVAMHEGGSTRFAVGENDHAEPTREHTGLRVAGPQETEPHSGTERHVAPSYAWTPGASDLASAMKDLSHEFNAAAARSAIVSASAGAASCPHEEGSRMVRVLVTFAPNGRVARASAEGLKGAAASCVASHFRGISVPPFSGAPVTVAKTVLLP